MIARRLTRLERLRSDDVADTVASEQESTRNLLLGISSNIRTESRQCHTKSQALEETEPQRD